MAKIYLKRDMDYFICSSVEEINAVAARLIGCGSHGLDMDEDINITHLYKVYKGKEN